jgi:hypothetical protein
MGVPHALGGLNWGRGTVSVSLSIVIAGFVAYFSVSRVAVGETTEPESLAEPA